MENKIPLEPEKYYHIYNHANGADNFFNDQDDYLNFLKGYTKYIVPICETFAYCLMPNHFHFFVKIKPEPELLKTLKKDIKTNTVKSNTISYRFSHFFNSYAQGFNKKYFRIGSLFKSNFQRKVVNTEKYFVKLVHYIHSNPVEDGFVNKPEEWEFSSYKSIISDLETIINRKIIIEHFGDIDNFKFTHQNPFES